MPFSCRTCKENFFFLSSKVIRTIICICPYIDNCSNTYCSTVWAVDNKFIYCSNPVDPKINSLSSNWLEIILLFERCRAIIKLCRADFSSNRNSSRWSCPHFARSIKPTLFSNQSQSKFFNQKPFKIEFIYIFT